MTANTFLQYSTFYLYGVAALGTTPAIVPYATGGDTIMTDGTYWYHTFVSSGTFTPAKALTADYLVVAGGGGGGQGGQRCRWRRWTSCTVGATGGGGSLESALSLGTSAYTVTIGAGGAGGPFFTMVHKVVQFCIFYNHIDRLVVVVRVVASAKNGNWRFSGGGGAYGN
jgi:hypothetical protein